MKLNLWMIANRLSELEPELHIPENAAGGSSERPEGLRHRMRYTFIRRAEM